MILTEKDIKNQDKVIGLRQVVRCIKSNQLRCVLIATDVDEHIKQEIVAKSTAKDIPYVIKFTQKKLGEIAEIDVKCATLGLLK
ncbi:MAG: ribosomal L7Ae/L30e/S12e/Gadd45 family protein [Christensenellales bacterium]|mgnify:CR=1 FL=1|jgi:ribosomal protein L7Ae-like RNA K-turn-binding protein|nr:hypothetical protein [Clostridiales bacterium]